MLSETTLLYAIYLIWMNSISLTSSELPHPGMTLENSSHIAETHIPILPFSRGGGESRQTSPLASVTNTDSSGHTRAVAAVTYVSTANVESIRQLSEALTFYEGGALIRNSSASSLKSESEDDHFLSAAGRIPSERNSRTAGDQLSGVKSGYVDDEVNNNKFHSSDAGLGLGEDRIASAPELIRVNKSRELARQRRDTFGSDSDDPGEHAPQDSSIYLQSQQWVSDRTTQNPNSQDVNTSVEVPSMTPSLGMAAKEKLELGITFLTPKTGYPKSPDVGRVTFVSSLSVNDTASVKVPENHAALISWWIRLRYPCEDDILELYVDNKIASHEGAQPSWSLCSADYHPRPDLLNVHALHIRFALQHKAAQKMRGFRLLFSFHEDPALPRQLSDGLWNCSLTHWPRFQQHVSCNLRVECAGGEDETGCGYTTEPCGPGRISAAGGCYMYVASRVPVSWNEARSACRRAGGYLASFNTERERRAVGRFLKNVSAFYLYAGMMSKNHHLPTGYRDIPKWDDGTMAYYGERMSKEKQEYCSSVDFSWDTSDFVRLKEIPCRAHHPADIMCEMEDKSSPGLAESPVSPPTIRRDNFKTTTVDSTIECPSGHLAYKALACDAHAACWGSGQGSISYACNAPIRPLPPSFECVSGLEFVPFSLVCDFRRDCVDGSDEDFCTFPPCAFDLFDCGNGQCIIHMLLCDGPHHCNNGYDEKHCQPEYRNWEMTSGLERLPYVVKYAAFPSFPFLIAIPPSPALKDMEWCKGNGFTCRTIDICMPLHLRCNGVNDCPGREDELDCDTCPGLYRCRGSSVCLDPASMCTGATKARCPQQDDDRFCWLPCPQNCTCYALSASCSQRFSARHISDLRFLEARGSGMKFADLVNKTMLVHLGLGDCGLRFLHHAYLPNIRFLDVSNNLLARLTVTSLTKFPKLRELVLNGNPLASGFAGGFDIDLRSFPAMTSLRLSHTMIEELDVYMLGLFPNLKELNMSGSGTRRVSGYQGLTFLTELSTLDVRQCPLTSVPPDFLRTLPQLRVVFADNNKLCCPAMLPEGFNLAGCHAPRDEISSCDALIRSDAYRLLLSLFSALALVGNVGSFTYRVVMNRSRDELGFGVFVTHLCLSNLLMGIYLAIIGVADRVYLGSYLWNDVAWKGSKVCSMAGFLSLLSSEVSAFLISLITLDRILVLLFSPRQLRFQPKSAHLTSVFVWSGGIVLAAIPLLPVTSNWHFYSQNGICVPLPITQRPFPGQFYSFALFSILNLLLCFLVALGQLSIFHTLNTSTLTFVETQSTSSKDLNIARRLITVAMSDFLCWFPIGVLGLLASNGIPIPGEVNVAMAILALPLNAALNPFLYTLNILMERRRRDREKRLLKIITAAGKETCVHPHQT